MSSLTVDSSAQTVGSTERRERPAPAERRQTREGAIAWASTEGVRRRVLTETVFFAWSPGMMQRAL